MSKLFSRLGGLLKALVAPAKSLFGKARAPSGPAPVIWFLVAVLALAIFVGAAYLNWTSTRIQQSIPGRDAWKRIWLPILVLLVYVLLWLSYRLVQLLRQEEDGGGYDDIDRAWQEGVATLHDKGIDLRDRPLFLVLGKPEGGASALFSAPGVELDVAQAPSRSDAPLHFFATRDAIYLTCPGACALGRFAKYLTEPLGTDGRTQDPDEEESIALRTATPDGPGSINVGAGGGLKVMAKVIRVAHREGRPLTKVEERMLRAQEREENPYHSPLRKPDEMKTQEARLAYLCRLVVRGRHPWCGVNGVLLLIPFAATDANQDATDTAEVIQADLAVAGRAFRMRCPHVALVCDMETAPGFTEFVSRFTAEARKERVGSGTPLRPNFSTSFYQAPNNKNAPMERMLTSLAQWVCQPLFTKWAYGKFRLEQGPDDKAPALTRGNAELFLLADALQERAKRLGIILARGLKSHAEPEEGTALFGGCYVAATGTHREHEQAFVCSVLKDVLQKNGRKYVYWTEQAVAEEAALQGRITLGWTVLGCLVAVELLLAALMFLKK
jgi:hypothetical protein